MMTWALVSSKLVENNKSNQIRDGDVRNLAFFA